LGTVSTVGFIVGAVGLVAGAYLYLSANGPPKAAVNARASRVSPFVGGDHVGLVF
jgi:hypothetical protein